MATTQRPTKPEPLQGEQKNDAEWLLDRVWRRMHKRDEHFVSALVGREGSGKSLTAIKMASVLYDDFDAEKNVIFYLDDFLEILKDEDYEQGEMFVLDEAGVQLGNRTWQDRAQVLGNQALQLIRSHNVGLIFTLPRLSELDKQARGRLQLVFELTEKVEGRHVKAKPMIIDPDRRARTGKIYQKFPKRTRGMGTRKVKSVRLSPPDESIIEVYDGRKAKHQEQQYEEAIAELRGESINDDEDEWTGPDAVAEDILDGEIDEYIREINGGAQVIVDQHKIRSEYDVGKDTARSAKALIDREVDIDVQ